ncbi:MAG TPA: hypothetical protein VFZ58_00410 [Candidatus Saccharimonadales bacterium]
MQSTVTREVLEALYKENPAAAIEAALAAMDNGSPGFDVAAEFLGRNNPYENGDATDILTLLPPGDEMAELLRFWRDDVNSEAFRPAGGEELLLTA